jgi:hypothetical protein
MVIERVVGMLKSRWRIILKMINMAFHHLLYIVIITSCLHVDNLCIIHGDAFDMDWARKVQVEMQI